MRHEYVADRRLQVPRKESYVENRVVAWARGYGILTTKVLGTAGWPDRAFWCKGGQVVLVEFKRPGERPRKLQAYVMKQLKDLGYHVFWTDNYEEAVAYLRARCA